MKSKSLPKNLKDQFDDKKQRCCEKEFVLQFLASKKKIHEGHPSLRISLQKQISEVGGN